MNGEINIFSWSAEWLTEQRWPYVASPLTTSTNDLAKSNAFSDPAYSIYLADQQTAGRGRGIHHWISPEPGSGLLASWSILVAEAPTHLTAPLIGLQVYRAVNRVWGDLPWSLKAPNDIYLENEKVGGLLAETLTRGSVFRLIVGLGFNVTKSPPSVTGAGCLSRHLRTPLRKKDWSIFLTQVHQGFLQAAQESAAIVLSGSVRKELTEAMRRHPESPDLIDVTAEGHLVYSNRTVDWHSL